MQFPTRTTTPAVGSLSAGFPPLAAPPPPMLGPLAWDTRTDEDHETAGNICSTGWSEAVVMVNRVVQGANITDPNSMTDLRKARFTEQVALARNAIDTILELCRGYISSAKYKEVEEADQRLREVEGKLDPSSYRVVLDYVGAAVQGLAAGAGTLGLAALRAIWEWFLNGFRRAY